MNRIILSLCLLVMSMVVCAQRRMVVCDIETLSPISQVSVRSLVFTHVNYESRLLNVDEVRDTVFLVSHEMSMSEVVVFGKGKDDGLRDRINKMLVLDKTEAQLLGSDPSQGGNLFGLIGKLLPKHRSRAEKRKQKAREIIENY